MPISVDVPGHGLVEFPDGTDEATMTKAIRGLTGAPERRNAPEHDSPATAGVLAGAGSAAALVPAALAAGKTIVQQVAKSPGLTKLASKATQAAGNLGALDLAYELKNNHGDPFETGKAVLRDQVAMRAPGWIQSAAAKVAPMLPEVGAAGAAGATLGAIVPVAFLRWLQSEAARRPEIDPHAKTLQASIFNVLGRTGSPDERRDYVVNHPDDDIAEAMINSAPSGEQLALRTARNTQQMGGRLRR